MRQATLLNARRQTGNVASVNQGKNGLKFEINTHKNKLCEDFIFVLAER